MLTTFYLAKNDHRWVSFIRTGRRRVAEAELLAEQARARVPLAREAALDAAHAQLARGPA